MDRVSSAGYALGYLGGGLLLAINLAWILKPALFGLPDAGVASRLSFLSVAIWWLVFSIPLFRRVPEPAVRPCGSACRRRARSRASFRQLGATLRELRRYRQAFLMLVAFLIYNDGIGTIIRMAGPYGQEIGLPENALITRVRDGAVRRHSVRVRVRRAGRAHRRQAVDLHRAHRLRHHQHRRLLHDVRLAVLPAVVPGGDGAGRQPGALAIALRDR